MLRSQEYTERLCHVFDADHLWKHYGIVSDTEVQTAIRYICLNEPEY